jgi:DNA-binding GntR family transcriptional regulator
MAMKFQPLKQGSIRSRIVDTLRTAMYTGRLRPGDPLLEMQLAREFHVSQSSVREALFQLERIGLVRRVPNKGTFVTDLSPEEVRERLGLRVYLETLAALQAAPRMNQEHVDELQEHVDKISTAIERNDHFGLARTDLEFHRSMWRISDNKTLYGVLDQIAAPMFAFVSMLRSNRLVDLSRVVIHSHQEMVNALVGGDEATIRAVMETHFVDSYEHFIHPGSGGEEGARTSQAAPGSAGERG